MLQKQRNAYLLRKYGITLAQYKSLLKKQGGGCAICQKLPLAGKSHAVDHNHVTGEIRGILCAYCNHRVIGRHRNADLLRRMAEYVSQGTGWFIPVKPKRKKKK